MGYERVRIGLLVIASLMTTGTRESARPAGSVVRPSGEPEEHRSRENLSRHVHH